MATANRSKKTVYKKIQCRSWNELREQLDKAKEWMNPHDDEMIWYRGVRDQTHGLMPSLMRETTGLSVGDHDQVEADLFFEFQAHAADLRARNLSDWEYMFFGRHYGVPTRVLDWTDTFGVALYFALEDWNYTPGGHRRTPDASRKPAIWLVNPYALNEKAWRLRDIILPKYLGFTPRKFWDYGEMLSTDKDWGWRHPVAIYPIQLNDRVRAQRGWFTIHGDSRDALETQLPQLVTQLTLEGDCVDQGLDFLALAGFNRFSIYTDMENLANWIRKNSFDWITKKRGTRP